MITPPTPTSSPFAEFWLELPDGRLFWLRGRCAIGRAVGSQLTLKASSVSRRHALLTVEPGGYAVSDLGSSNGTYVNRTVINRPILLQDGDELRLGDVLLRYRCTRPREAGQFSPRPNRTRQAEKGRDRACWLLLAELSGVARRNIGPSGTAARQRFRGWIAGLRPLIERHGGHIECYGEDSVFAWWPADRSSAMQVRASLGAIEAWRTQSPAEFRVVLHHGSVRFIRGERAEELSGQEVSFLFGSAKVAATFGAPAMLSEEAARSLQLTAHCRPLGASRVEGVSGRFVFFAPPTDSPA